MCSAMVCFDLRNEGKESGRVVQQSSFGTHSFLFSIIAVRSVRRRSSVSDSTGNDESSEVSLS